MTQPQPGPAIQREERPARQLLLRGEACHICGDPTDERLDSSCRVCSKPVHVAWTEGAPDSACSQIVNPMNCCGIAFVCNECVPKDAPSP